MGMIIESSRNCLGNARNPFQGGVKKVLCVCSAGLLRSPTMANVLHEAFGFNTRAVGAIPQFALIPVSTALLAWADEIVFVDFDAYSSLTANVDDEHKIRMEFNDENIIVLDIPDEYEWNDEVLREECLRQYLAKGSV